MTTFGRPTNKFSIQILNSFKIRNCIKSCDNIIKIIKINFYSIYLNIKIKKLN